MTILIIEDEQKLVDIVKRALTIEGYTVDTATDGKDGLEKALKNNYDLILLDLMFQKKIGMDVCKELRSRGIHTPIIMLTAVGIARYRVLELDIGADDYMGQPCD